MESALAALAAAREVSGRTKPTPASALFDLCTDEALDLFRTWRQRAEGARLDLHHNEPCGACLWGAGLFHCLS